MVMRVCGRPNVDADVAQVRTEGIRRAGISRQPPDAKHFLTECQAQHFLDYVLAGLPVCLPAWLVSLHRRLLCPCVQGVVTNVIDILPRTSAWIIPAPKMCLQLLDDVLTKGKRRR